MKVYELINMLSECEAGAEVMVRQTMTIKELAGEDIISTDNGDVLYSMAHSVCDVENEDNKVNLYTE